MLGSATTSIDVPAWIAIVAAILGVATTLAAAIAVARQAAIRASLETIIQANDELRKDNADLRLRLDAEVRARASLEGKLELFTSHFAEQIVQAVIATVKRTSELAARSPLSRDRKDDNANHH